jgi:putative ATP-dependent endonuclease of OLD family
LRPFPRLFFNADNRPSVKLRQFDCHIRPRRCWASSTIRLAHRRIALTERIYWGKCGKRIGWAGLKLVNLRICNFQSFGIKPVTISLDSLTYILGPNGSGKTAALQALVRMFGLDPSQRRVRATDFHRQASEAELPSGETRVLWIEADFEVPEAADPWGMHATVPAFFDHMKLKDDNGTPCMRIRLAASMDADGEIEEKLRFVTQSDPQGTPLESSEMSKHDRNMIQVHYLPARRDPAEHISYASSTLLGRALRAADWSAEKSEIGDLTKKIGVALDNNRAVADLGVKLSSHWGSVHSGKFFTTPSVSFGFDEFPSLFRHLTLNFLPSLDQEPVDFNRLSDGQKSLLYITLVISMQAIGRDVLAGKSKDFDPDKLRPAVFTLIAVEEPENSLSPHYLGRIIKALRTVSGQEDSQALIATHAPALLRRVAPEHIRYFRLDPDRTTTVKRIILPERLSEAYKYVREAVEAYPELYFARLVVLGEGDSEEIVLPRVLGAKNIGTDDTSIAVVPLGGRHVNHFWRLLHGLDIPHVTLLDLDAARYQGGWGRIDYAAKQLKKYSSGSGLTDDRIKALPDWKSVVPIVGKPEEWRSYLEHHNIFFSEPMDLDFSMLRSYSAAYGVEDHTALSAPSKETLLEVLGKARTNVEFHYDVQDRNYFTTYERLFKSGSKPTGHLEALSKLADTDLLASLPVVFERMTEKIHTLLEDLPE